MRFIRVFLPPAAAGVMATPVEVRRSGLRSMRRMLPRMQLAGRASAILHPLIRVLEGPSDDLRKKCMVLNAQTKFSKTISIVADFFLLTTI